MLEQEIITLIRARDERGAEALLNHYGPLMRYIIMPILSNAQDCEECLSEAAMRVWDKIDQYTPERGSWHAWLTALTRNMALNYLRRNKQDGGLSDIPPQIPSSESTPEETIMQRERSEAVTHALNLLPSKERILFYRKYYYLQSTIQIAAELGMTERAVEGQLYRTKKKLRKLLGGEADA